MIIKVMGMIPRWLSWESSSLSRIFLISKFLRVERRWGDKTHFFLRFFQLRIPCQYQFSSVAQSCPTLCDPMNPSTPGLPLHHQLPEFTQTHVHRVGDAIQPSHPLSSPSPPAPNPSQHQNLFQWVNSSHEVARVLEFQLQHQSFQRNPRADLLAAQGTLKSLLKHHSSKASILRRSAVFTYC